MRNPWKCLLAQCLADSKDSGNCAVIIQFLLPIPCQTERTNRKRFWSRKSCSSQVSNWNSVTVIWHLSQFFHLWDLKMVFAVHTQHQAYTTSEVNADPQLWKVKNPVCGVVIASQRKRSPSLFSNVRVEWINLWKTSFKS